MRRIKEEKNNNKIRLRRKIKAKQADFPWSYYSRDSLYRGPDPFHQATMLYIMFVMSC